ncbi:MAG: hypothetical protein HQ564_10395 [Candidatus Saganbacteria bacterium]|nr:hypothetical protein [Candidatus Saganbacteria bacterium]
MSPKISLSSIVRTAAAQVRKNRDPRRGWNTWRPAFEGMGSIPKEMSSYAAKPVFDKEVLQLLMSNDAPMPDLATVAVALFYGVPLLRVEGCSLSLQSDRMPRAIEKRVKDGIISVQATKPIDVNKVLAFNLAVLGVSEMRTIKSPDSHGMRGPYFRDDRINKIPKKVTEQVLSLSNGKECIDPRSVEVARDFLNKYFPDIPQDIIFRDLDAKVMAFNSDVLIKTKTVNPENIAKQILSHNLARSCYSSEFVPYDSVSRAMRSFETSDPEIAGGIIKAILEADKIEKRPGPHDSSVAFFAGKALSISYGRGSSNADAAKAIIAAGLTDKNLWGNSRDKILGETLEHLTSDSPWRTGAIIKELGFDGETAGRVAYHSMVANYGWPSRMESLLKGLGIRTKKDRVAFASGFGVGIEELNGVL